MYTDEKNALIVLALLRAHGVRKIIVSPGAMNIPISGSVGQDPFFEVFSAVDERHAAYMACGMAASSGEPVVLSCTGATSSRNYLPGLTEAFYRKLPILAITSMRPPAAVGNLRPQMTDRSCPPPDAVRLSVRCPVVTSKAGERECLLNANRAILELFKSDCGPVHINLERGPEKKFSTAELPAVRVIRRHCQAEGVWPELDPATRIVVFVGSHRRFSEKEKCSLANFVCRHDAVVLTDHTGGGYDGPRRVLSALACAQICRRKPKPVELCPDLLIHIGEISGDYFTSGFLKGSAPVWRVNVDGKLRDTFEKLTEVFAVDESAFFDRYSEGREERESGFYAAWVAYDAEVRSHIPQLPFSGAWIASYYASRLPSGSGLHLAILNSLRCLNYFPVAENVDIQANVGGFGIDGCTSSAIGASLVRPDRLQFLVTGDLAFFYDLNALGSRHVGANLRIILVNNGGGAEFCLPTSDGEVLGGEVTEYVSAGRHFGNRSKTLVRDYSRNLGFEYLTAESKSEFEDVLPAFVSASSKKPILLECFTSLTDERSAICSLDGIDNCENDSVPSQSGLLSRLRRKLSGIVSGGVAK